MEDLFCGQSTRFAGFGSGEDGEGASVEIVVWVGVGLCQENSGDGSIVRRMIAVLARGLGRRRQFTKFIGKARRESLSQYIERGQRPTNCEMEQARGFLFQY